VKLIDRIAKLRAAGIPATAKKPLLGREKEKAQVEPVGDRVPPARGRWLPDADLPEGRRGPTNPIWRLYGRVDYFRVVDRPLGITMSQESAQSAEHNRRHASIFHARFLAPHTRFVTLASQGNRVLNVLDGYGIHQSIKLPCEDSPG